MVDSDQATARVFSGLHASKHTYTPACTRTSVPQRQKTKMARKTDVHEDYTHRQGVPSREDQPRSWKQGDQKWHDKCFKVNLMAPVQCHLQDRIMEHEHKQMATIFPGPAEVSLESNETFTGADEWKG